MPSSHLKREYVPTILTNEGDLPAYVNMIVAATPAEALAFARSEAGGEVCDDEDGYEVTRALMRELDSIACKIRGVDEGWWTECTSRSKKARPFWKIDA